MAKPIILVSLPADFVKQKNWQDKSEEIRGYAIRHTEDEYHCLVAFGNVTETKVEVLNVQNATPINIKKLQNLLIEKATKL